MEFIDTRNVEESPAATLKGVGPAIAQKLEKLGIRNVFDLLLHLPLRYEDRTRVIPIGGLQPGDQAVVEGTITLTEVAQRRKRMLLCRIQDGSGSLTLRFFRFSRAQQEALKQGRVLRCFGEVRRGAVTLEMIHPEYSDVATGSADNLDTHLTPVYPATDGLTQRKLRDLINTVLKQLDVNPQRLDDHLPESFRTTLPNLHDTLFAVHRPAPSVDSGDIRSHRLPAQRRLAYEELLAHHLSMRALRANIQAVPAPSLAGKSLLQQKLLEHLPFALTNAQSRVCDEIVTDLTLTKPMMRLLQGDVGSGKTVVAAIAALQAIDNGWQVALMAPTELLAEQHTRNFHEWFTPLGIEVVQLSGRRAGKARERALEVVKTAQMSVGTHALFQDDVEFDKLGLVIVDEQHRFGVHQRLALRDKGKVTGLAPHQLIMTATPIPRTLSMTAYADLDCSVIDELPPGRQEITTVVIDNVRRQQIIERVHAACLRGEQCYWVCTLVEESDALQAEAAEATAEMLQEALPDLAVGLVHGRMKGAEKQQIMSDFKAAKLTLLVATTVIEVGVDVPNATLMIIENAERLGLAQLHQLRGRVGRGNKQSACVLSYKAPLGKVAKQRLSVMRQTNDGFQIAEKDLEIRGPGELMGTKQTGVAEFKIADLERDAHLLPLVQIDAERLIRQFPDAAEALTRRWVGASARYADVG